MSKHAANNWYFALPDVVLPAGDMPCVIRRLAARHVTGVKLTLKSGKVIELKRETVKGSPQDPMADAEMRGKVRGCLEFGLGASATDVERLADVVASLEKSGDAAKAIVDAFPAQK